MLRFHEILIIHKRAIRGSGKVDGKPVNPTCVHWGEDQCDVKKVLPHCGAAASQQPSIISFERWCRVAAFFVAP